MLSAYPGPTPTGLHARRLIVSFSAVAGSRLFAFVVHLWAALSFYLRDRLFPDLPTSSCSCHGLVLVFMPHVACSDLVADVRRSALSAL